MLGELKDSICWYLQETRDATIEAHLTRAINNAVKSAERLHDWEYQRKPVTLAVDPESGADISDAVLESDGVTSVRIKLIDTAYLKNEQSGGQTIYYPIEVNPKKNVATWLKNRNYRDSMFDPRWRYLADWQVSYPGSPLRAFALGTRFYIEPLQSEVTTIAFDAVVWSDELLARDFDDGGDTSDNTTNWMIQHGHDYLMWYAICELNHRTSTFVYRAEGFLNPPEKARDAALEELQMLDSDIWERGRIIDTPR